MGTSSEASSAPVQRSRCAHACTSGPPAHLTLARLPAPPARSCPPTSPSPLSSLSCRCRTARSAPHPSPPGAPTASPPLATVRWRRHWRGAAPSLRAWGLLPGVASADAVAFEARYAAPATERLPPSIACLAPLLCRAGVLELANATHAKWAWHRTIDIGGETGATDQVWLAKPPAGSCANGRAAAAQGAGSGLAPASALADGASASLAPGSSAGGGGHGMPPLLLLLGAVAAAAALVQ